jgi:hypothetical protein
MKSSTEANGCRRRASTIEPISADEMPFTSWSAIRIPNVPSPAGSAV